MEQSPNKKDGIVRDKNEFKTILAHIKEESEDIEETKRCISVIARVLNNAFENCKDELNKQEILEQFLKEYKKELEFRGKTDFIFPTMMRVRGWRDIIDCYHSDKEKFNALLNTAKEEEWRRPMGRIHVNVNKDENMVAMFRSELRANPSIREENMISFMQKAMIIQSKKLKNTMIEIIQSSVSFLDSYGYLDYGIEESNNKFDGLGLSRLKLKKRNPLSNRETVPEPDGKILAIVNDKGKKIEYSKNDMQVSERDEDIGVLDSFTTELLNQNSLEDLIMMTTFWQSKYWELRLEMSKAMSTIDTLELWAEMIEKGEMMMNDLDDQKVVGALKKELSLTHLFKHEIEINPKISEQYKTFMQKNGFYKKGEGIMTDLKKVKPELENLTVLLNDITILQCLVLQQLREKSPAIKTWGIIKFDDKIEDLEDEQKESRTSNVVRIGLEHQNFRGPLIIEMSGSVLRSFLKIESEDELPIYINNENLDSKLTNLYLPVTEYFKRVVKQEYKASRSSPLLSYLNGKTVKKAPGQLGGDHR